MNLEIKNIHSPDLANTNANKNSSTFYILLQFDVGEVGENSADTFDIIICSKDSLGRLDLSEGFTIKDHFIAKKFSLPMIKKSLNEYIHQIKADNWYSAAQEIDKIAKWEYRNYKTTQ